MYKVRTKTYSPALVPNDYGTDLMIANEEIRFSSFKFRYSGYYWTEGNIPHYNRLVTRAYYQPYHFRKDPVPYTGCKRKRSERGIRYGRYAREVLSYQEVPPRDKLRSRYSMFIDPWGFYDTEYTQYYAQPKRDWKRTKVKRQFMKHKGHFGKTHREFMEEHLEEFPFDAKLLEKELLNNTNVRLSKYGSPYNFVPDDLSKYKEETPSYVFVREDGDYEFECPSCGLLNMTNFKWYSEPWSPVKCDYCDQYITF